MSLGHQFQQPGLNKQFFKQKKYRRYRDAIHIKLNPGEAWLFDYGVVILWGVNESEKFKLLGKVEPYIGGPAVKYEVENFRFELNTDNDRIHHDTIQLNSDDPLHRLAVSHAMAQSIKLNVYEDKAQQTIMKTRHFSRSLAETGRIKLSRKNTAKMRGELFSTKSDIILNYGLLDTPDFFWEYPELEGLYEQMTRYLEIRQRVSLLSNKLETIQALFQMLDNEQKHQHSSRLEWIIIILIAVEIIYFALNEAMH